MVDNNKLNDKNKVSIESSNKKQVHDHKPNPHNICATALAENISKLQHPNTK